MPRRRRFALVCPVLASMWLGGCDQPPNKELAAAEKQLESARQAGAEKYAPERLREAEAALQNAQSEVREKDYRGALRSASDAAEKARAAAQAVKVARINARAQAAIAQVEIQAALDRVAAMRKEAEAAKVPDSAFAEWDEKVKEIGRKLAEIPATLQRGEEPEAAQTAAELKAEAAPLPDLYREARERWEAEHPKGRGRKRNR